MHPNGWQYGQWRFAAYDTIHRYKPLCVAERFKSPQPPPLAILPVELNLSLGGSFTAFQKNLV